MKKRTKIICSLLLVGALIFSLLSYFTVRVPTGEIIAVFQYDDIDIMEPLSDEDAETVRKIFNGKILSSESPSCGFGEDVALVVGNNTYCIACDTCGVVYLAEKDKYFYLSDKENETLRTLLGEYGFVFPCL